MFNKLILAASLATVATPALAQNTNSNFTGVRVEATAGVDDLNRNISSSDVTYGAAIGADIPLGDRFTIGAEANADNVFNHEDIGVSARLGFAVNQNLLLYANAGYASYRNLDGLRLGGGAELSIAGPFYTKVEYRYSDLEANVGRHSGLVGVGVRF